MRLDRPLTVVLAEDDALLREGLVTLLERFGHRVAAAVRDAPALRAAVRDLTPDALVTDVRMPPDMTDDGLRAAVELRAEHPGLPVLVLSQYVQHTYAAELLNSGDGLAVGYLLKDRVGNAREFAEALVRVAGGGTVVDPEVVRQLLRRRENPLQRLTQREREVLELMAQGKTNAAISRGLFVTEAAVAKHIGSIFLKLDLTPGGDDHRRVLAVLAYLRA
ncbi:DNA-binding response regulator [Acrocarpospora pleiomorpha]|uniref:DNA-binding response regulator n=1 Tax=Acrocarpospora pleiomorpha TaxID=90975 RepID=A0A5M3Y035_9ACTN|nr:response regulator transcription factor [Acrocarpospora pleiomorpha]GES24018.1 DNA-binding response regulator [Acrocarpospora pleiomorpha]